MALPIIKSAPKKALGVHVGASQIRVVELERVKGELRLSNIGWTETPSEAYVGSHMENPSIVAGAISRLLASRNIRTKRVIGTMDGNEVIQRTITLPSMAKKDLRKAIVFETEASLPSTGEENILDYQIFRVFEDPEDNSEQVEVLIMSTQRQNAVALAEALTQADLKPAAIDFTPVASFRSEKRSEAFMEHGEDLIVISINDRSTDLAIIHQGHLRIIRTLPIGAMNILDVIGEKPLFEDRVDKLEKGQAEKEEKQEEIPPEQRPFQSFDPFGGGSDVPFGGGGSAVLKGSHEVVGVARIDGIITDLADETLNTIRYGQSYGKEQSEVKYAIINGYFPYREDFILSLSDKLGMDVFPGAPFSGIDISGSHLEEELIDRFAPNFSTACGLALRGVGEYE